MIVVPSTNVIRRGVIIGFANNLGHGLNGFLVGRNLNKSSKLPMANIGVVGTPQMVFINPNTEYPCAQNYKQTTNEFDNY